VLLTVVTAVAVVPASAATVPPPGRLGTNLGAITYYDGIVPFTNLVRQAGDWIPQRTGAGWGEGDPLELRRDGWPARLLPGQYATAPLAEVRYPAGRYTVSWRGSGRFDINGVVFAGAGGSGAVQLDGSSLVLLSIRSTDPLNPLRDIRVVVPGESPQATFRAAYLASLRPYRAVRFMDWQRTNSVLWEERRSFRCGTRVLPTHYSQGTSAGASVEVMVELANALGAQPWFTVPHEAWGDWVSCHASVVAARLGRALTPRYEFSNETWNPTFRAFHELTDEARARGLGDGDDFLGLQQRVGQRHARTMTLVGAQMRAAGRPFIRVLSGQAANSWVLEQRLLVTGAAAATDEIAIAPYLFVAGLNPYESADAAIMAGWSRSQLVAAMSRAQTAEVDVWTADHVGLARQFGKRLVAYEGGQHLAGDPSNTALTSLFVGLNRSTAIAPLYRTYLNRWRAATGNALMMHFTDVGPYTRWGSWGALERPEQAAAGTPKYAELRRFAQR